jgi:hypothetical protein
MVLANSAVEDGQTTQDRARAAIEAHSAKAGEPINSEPIAISKGRRLDVDAVLAGSLAKVVGE